MYGHGRPGLEGSPSNFAAQKTAWLSVREVSRDRGIGVCTWRKNDLSMSGAGRTKPSEAKAGARSWKNRAAMAARSGGSSPETGKDGQRKLPV